MIDAGWYDDDAGGRWDSVGAWTEAPSRFPGAPVEFLDRVSDAGRTSDLGSSPK